MTTITDIAKKLGVAPSTVSRALRDSDQVSPETRRWIQAEAAQMNYTPNLLARSLVRAHTETIGILILEFANPFFIPLIQAIEDVVETRGYTVMISQSHRSLKDEQRALRHFEMMRLLGVIVTPTLQETSHLVELERRGLPVIAVGRTAPELECISVDNRAGGMLAGEHLFELGHRKIGMVTSGEPFNIPEELRLEGLRLALAGSGLELCSEWLFSAGSSDPTGGERAAEDWLALAERPTAVFCATDRLALGFIHHLQAAGCRVPSDVSVIGFDDIPFSEYMKVPLTTIDYPKYPMGRLAAERLIQRIEHPDSPPERGCRLLSPHLVVRESSGGVV